MALLEYFCKWMEFIIVLRFGKVQPRALWLTLLFLILNLFMWSLGLLKQYKATHSGALYVLQELKGQL